jgi:hypothetical protein
VSEDAFGTPLRPRARSPSTRVPPRPTFEGGSRFDRSVPAWSPACPLYSMRPRAPTRPCRSRADADRDGFIAFENVGYALLNHAFLFIGLAIVRMPSRLWRAAGWIFAGGGALTMASLVLYSALYGTRLDYRFAVAAVGISWLVLIAVFVLSSIGFARRPGPAESRPSAAYEMSSEL